MSTNQPLVRVTLAHCRDFLGESEWGSLSEKCQRLIRDGVDDGNRMCAEIERLTAERDRMASQWAEASHGNTILGAKYDRLRAALEGEVRQRLGPGGTPELVAEYLRNHYRLADTSTSPPHGWCPICGGQNDEHKPGCEPQPGDGPP